MHRAWSESRYANETLQTCDTDRCLFALFAQIGDPLLGVSLFHRFFMCMGGEERKEICFRDPIKNVRSFLTSSNSCVTQAYRSVVKCPQSGVLDRTKNMVIF